MTHICVKNYAIIASDNALSPDRRQAIFWRHNGHDSVSNHQPHDCLFNRLFRRRSKKTSKLCFTVLCAGNSPGTGEFPAQMASNAENVAIWWRHHAILNCMTWSTKTCKMINSHSYFNGIICIDVQSELLLLMAWEGLTGHVQAHWRP